MEEQELESGLAFERKLVLIQLAGVVITVLWAGVLASLVSFRPEPYAGTWWLIVTQLTVGRAYSVSAGINGEFPKLFLLLQCSLQDIVVLLLAYPLLVAGYQRAVETPFVGPAIAKARAVAERHKSKVAQFGALGLVVFVFFPLWSTGALAGAVIGYLLGMRTAIAFLSVIAGNFLAVACWIWFFDQMRLLSAAFGHSLTLTLIVVGVLLASVFRVIHLRRQAAQAEFARSEENDGTGH